MALQQCYNYEKKALYPNCVDDFLGDEELTVTITLHEYRNLIEAATRYLVENNHLRNRIREYEQAAAFYPIVKEASND